METKHDAGLCVKVALIPEEKTRWEWRVAARSFGEVKHPIDVKDDCRLEGWIYRAGANVYVDGETKVIVKLSCSRCLDKFELPLEIEVSSVFMPTDEQDNGTKDELDPEGIEAQGYEGDEINIFPAVLDQVSLSMPMRPLCDESCQGLCPVCGFNLNTGKCGCEVTDADPRFAALKELVNKQEKTDAST